MEKNELQSFVLSGYSLRDIAKRYDLSYTTIKYWIDKYDLKTKKRTPPHCGQCGELNPAKFYGNKKTICGSCHNKDVINKGRQNKSLAVSLLGGKCIICNYKKCDSALEFHHLDDKKKDAFFKHKKGWSFERLKKELDGCVLLCANCHREIHAGVITIK